MKMSKKVLSVFLACMMLFTAIACVASAKTSAEADTHLQFNADGEFKILQIADMQDGFPMKLITKNLIKKAIETEILTLSCLLVIISTAQQVNQSLIQMQSMNS